MGIVNICPRCKTEKPILGDFRFRYKGLWLRIFCDGVICKNCTKEGIIDDFEEYAGKLIKKRENGKVIFINWDYYKNIPIGRNHYTLNQILVSLDILSYKLKNNYEITDGNGNSCNPNGSFNEGSILFFKKESDALEYILRVLSPKIESWNWEIRKIIKVIDHNDFRIKSKV
ncbi:hypothetical protein KJ763_00450 [Patescibacteria group bacterium]|nr:hypothetical protein [Patescibacteria group bacterium]